MSCSTGTAMLIWVSYSFKCAVSIMGSVRPSWLRKSWCKAEPEGIRLRTCLGVGISCRWADLLSSSTSTLLRNRRPEKIPQRSSYPECILREVDRMQSELEYEIAWLSAPPTAYRHMFSWCLRISDRCIYASCPYCYHVAWLGSPKTWPES